MQNRQNALNKWLNEIGYHSDYILSPLTGDASFRHYFRLLDSGLSRIVMDAPPDKEKLRPFVMIAKLLRQAGIMAPTVHAYDEVQGFALLDDFGDRLLLDELNPGNVDALYSKALSTLVNLQNCSAYSPYPLPLFDKAFMLKELDLFKTWFLDKYLQLKLNSHEENIIEQSFQQLIKEIADQPQVFIHRDFHSRNIMLLKESEQLGIIDFQDAMLGPLTYDLVSLLKDCYIQWPRDQILNWVSLFHQRSSIAQSLSLPALIRAFDFCGLQRHLKVLGIFSRLALRDNKPNYLKDLPLTLHYTMACLESYEELQPLYQFMQQRVKLP